MKNKPYGGILNVHKYFIEQYGQQGRMCKIGRALTINTDSMETISGRRTRNCSVVAIARLIDYYRQKDNIKSIPDNVATIYKSVEEIAESYGYSDKVGTMPFFISSIAKEAFKKYGVKAKCRGHYIFSFEKHVKREIESGRPVIMNIARGFYKDHTIVVSGYSIWKIGDKEYPVLRVIDGWKSGYHFLDYEAFAKDITQSIFGSFNTINLK